MAEKFNREKEKSEKLKELKARLNFEGCSETSRYSQRSHSRYTKALSDSEDNRGGYRKSRSKKKKSCREKDDLSQPWVCEEVDPFTPRIRYFDFPKTRMPSHIKTYDGSEDPEDHLKIFLATAKTERWAIPTWCHMFNSTLMGNARVWFDDLSSKSIDIYDDLKKAFLEYYLQQKKCIKDPIEIHNIKQREGESTEDFVKRYKLKSRDVKGARECMRISGFVHGITNPELIKRLHDKIPKTVNEIMRVTKSFLRGEVAASNHEQKKTFPPWKHHEGNQKQNFKKEASGTNKVGHKIDECMHLRKQIEEMLKAGKLSHLIKELKQNNGKKQPKVTKKGETSGKDKAGEIIRPIWQIQLLVKIGDEEHSASAWMNFVVVRSPSSYNGIIGRPRVRKLQAVPSTAHGMLKIPGCSSVRQKKRGQAADRNHAIQEEVGKLRMCVDFKDLNKACPKDDYPLPEIDWRVESLCGFPFKCFLDAYKGYHQIQMAKEDEEKNAFITSQGIFCYTKVPFGLRNVGATYQRLVDKAFHKQIGRNLEVYVDDLVIKSRTKDEIVRDIEETFKTLREINMKLNPKKCTFRVEEGMFLGYKVNTKGLKVCPDKVDVVLTEKSLLFFKTLKKCMKKSDFHWTTEAEEEFKQMKQLIAELPILKEPMEKEELIVYLAAAKETVSAVLMMEREAKQMPIYFVNRALRGPELNYTSMEKLVLALVHASKRLKRYFQAHPIIVITNQPIQQILSRPKVAGRLQKWRIELGEYAIHYRPRVSVKGQILADFIVERPEEDSSDTLMEVEEKLPEPWILFTDGSSCTDGSGAGLILTNPEGIKFTYALRFRFDATNNEAEYEALIAGLRIAEQMGMKNLQVNVDSRLVVNQVNRTYAVKEDDMIRYLEKVKTLIRSFKAFSIKQIPRSENKKAYALSKIASTSFAHLRNSTNGYEESKGNKTQAHDPSWLKTCGPVIIGLPCTKTQRTLIRACQDCQVHKPVPRNPQQKLTPITSPWPFYKWGIDIARPFPEGPRKVKFLIVAMDYFTKWIEAKSVVTITGNQIKKFVWDNIVCKFGLPGEIISDNGKQFRDDPFKDWCEKLCIRQHFTSVKHPQTNGLVERANRSFEEEMKARLDARSKNWMEELPHVMWVHRTMIKSSNGDTLFSLTYGT
ncbi:reverse transcriptase domain-containing protein [Tanacetum coccineum]